MTVESAPAEDLRMDAGALLGALWARAVRIVIVTVLLVVATFVVLMFVPKQYESSAGLLVEDRSSSFTQAATAATTTGAGGISIDALMSSQIELIKSRDTLLAVVDQLNLRSVPEFNGGGTNPLTLFLTLIKRMSLRPLMSSNITGPAVFRTVEAFKPTLLIDEADTFRGSCTARSMVHPANMAASFMMAAWANWLRDWPIVRDFTLELASMDLSIQKE